jgi:hypothetical protein
VTYVGEKIHSLVQDEDKPTKHVPECNANAVQPCLISLLEGCAKGGRGLGGGTRGSGRGVEEG